MPSKPKPPFQSPVTTKQTDFRRWCAGKGLIVKRIRYKEIPGRGLGIIATSRIEAGTDLVHVPSSALLTVNTIPEDFRSKHPKITVHGLLASFLAFDGESTATLTPWTSTWPSLDNFRSSMPLLWCRDLKVRVSQNKPADAEFEMDVFSVLPPAIKGFWLQSSTSQSYEKTGFVAIQEKKLRADWGVVTGAFPDASFERYVYFWLAVNSRSLYYQSSEAVVHPPREDRMTLCPFIDLFNHNNVGIKCEVKFDSDGFTVTSDKIYERGEEIYVSYGRHSNDFLLAEYGFMLDQNSWDSLIVDDLLMTHIADTPDEDRLRLAGYLGNYNLNIDGFCHRTEVAVRTQTLGSLDWQRFVDGVDASHARDEEKVSAFIAEWILKPCYCEIQETAERIRKMDILPLKAQTLLLQRWAQIKSLIMEAAHKRSTSDPSPNQAVES